MTEEKLLQQADNFIKNNKEAIVEDIRKLVAVPSVEGESTPDAPFGEEPKRALEVALKIAKDMGFETDMGDAYVGWAELPVGDGWDADPFTMREKSGWLIGRGVIDDKGPAVISLYLAKFFKELEMELNYSLRVLFGTNEETGMQDVEYYLANNEEPVFCFSPDSNFPVCNAEKGVYQGDFTSAKLDGNIIDIYGGIASNVVPDSAHCTIQADAAKLPKAEHITVTEKDGNAYIEATGVGAHAARPEGARNAISVLVNYIMDNGLVSDDEATYLELLQRIFATTDGSRIGIAAEDDIFDPLTCIGGMIRYEDGRIRQNVNIRFPTTTSGSALTEKLTALAHEVGGTYKAGRIAEPHHISADSEPIQAVLAAYNDVTGDNGTTYAMGGGTYARHFKQGVAFGPSYEDRELPDFVGEEHEENEGIQIDNLLEALKIYILSVYRLQQLDF